MKYSRTDGVIRRAEVEINWPRWEWTATCRRILSYLTIVQLPSQRHTAACGPDAAASRSTAAPSWSRTWSRFTSAMPGRVGKMTASAAGRRTRVGGDRDDTGGLTVTFGWRQVRSTAAGRVVRGAGSRSTPVISSWYTRAFILATSLTGVR